MFSSLLICYMSSCWLQSGMFPVSKKNNASELHVSLRYVGDYYNEFETLFGTFSILFLILVSSALLSFAGHLFSQTFGNGLPAPR